MGLMCIFRTHMPKDRTVLIVDAELDFIEWAVKQVTSAGMRALHATTADEGFTIFERERPDLVVTDTQLQPYSGTELLTRIRRRDPNAFVLLVSQHGTTQAVIEA